MRPLHALFALLVATALTACAQDPATQVASNATAADPGSPRQVCTRELKIGSQIPVTVCTTPESGAAQRQRMDDFKAQVKPQPRAAGN